MKVLLLLGLILLSYQANAQAELCPAPLYITRISSYLKKSISDVLVSADKDRMQYIESKHSAKSSWLFTVNYAANNQHIEFVFVNSLCDTVIITGDSCICDSEIEYIKRQWLYDASERHFINKEKTREAMVDDKLNNPNGCIAFRIL